MGEGGPASGAVDELQDLREWRFRHRHPCLHVLPIPGVGLFVGREVALLEDRVDEVRLHEGLPAGDEDRGLGDGSLPQESVHDPDLAPGPLGPRQTDRLEVGDECSVVAREVEAEHVHLEPVEVGVHLDPHRQGEPQPLRLREHGAAVPGIGPEGVVVGDREVSDPVPLGAREERPRIEPAVAHRRMQVEVG
jgi:hypothetical protein